MLNKIVNDISDFELGDILKSPVDLLVVKGPDIVTVDFGRAVDLILGANHKPVFEFDPHVLCHFLVFVLFDDKTLSHTCEQWLVNYCTQIPVLLPDPHDHIVFFQPNRHI